MRRIISTCGTSIAKDVKPAADKKEDYCRALRDRVDKIRQRKPDDTAESMAEIAAETNALSKLDASKTDKKTDLAVPAQISPASGDRMARPLRSLLLYVISFRWVCCHYVFFEA